MRKRVFRVVLTALFALAVATLALPALATAGTATTNADTVVLNGYVYTVDAQSSVAQAVAVKGGKIALVGSNAAVSKLIGPKTRVVDAKGHMVMPSFIDSHTHTADVTNFVYPWVDLYAVSPQTVQSMVDATKALHQQYPGSNLIKGYGWQTTQWTPNTLHKEDLDAISTTVPITLYSDSTHAIWCNSRALELAGISASTPDPQAGIVERVPGTADPASGDYGEPDGVVREAAMLLVKQAMPGYSVDEYKFALKFYQDQIAAPLGITGVWEAWGTLGDASIEAYEELAQAGQMNLWVHASLAALPWYDVTTWMNAAQAERAKHTTPYYRFTSIKYYVDGLIETHSGYLSRPYYDAVSWNGDPNFRGQMYWDEAELTKWIIAADKAGFSTHYHCIADGSVHAVLDAIQKMKAMKGSWDSRDAITHLTLVDQGDFRRFRDLGVVAVGQPQWDVADIYHQYYSLYMLGPIRADSTYPVKSFFDNGVVYAGSADAPPQGYNPSPLWGIQTGVMRWFQTDLWGFFAPRGVMNPLERATVQQMIRAYTINGAYANFMEKSRGSLEVGKSADLVVLDKNILTCLPQDIGWNNRVLLTMFEGREIYSDGTL
jgi:predicted amidohydrolase YtcJ